MVNNLRKIGKGYLVGFSMLVLVSLLGWHKPIELKIYDLFLKTRPKTPFSESVIVLEIEEEVKEDGLWPWREEWLPYLINYLSGLGVKTILVDSSLEQYLNPEHPVIKSLQAKVQIFYPQKNSSELIKKDLIIDSDGKIRRYRLFTNGEKSLILQTFLAYRKQNLPFSLPKDFWIVYNKNKNSGWGKYTYFDLVISMFLSSRQEPAKIDFSRFKDKICIISLSPSVLGEFYPTPLGMKSPLEIRLQVLDNLLQDDLLLSLNKWENTGILLLISLLSLAIFLKAGAKRRNLYLFLFIIFYFLVSFLLFSIKGLWMDSFLPICSSFYIFLSITIHRYSRERMLRKEEEKKELAGKLKNETFINTHLTDSNIEIVVRTSPTHEVEGDFFDIIRIEDNQIGVLLGRAPGRGLDTVNYIIKLVNEFRLQAPLYRKPRVLLNAVNNVLFAEGTKGMYATCLYILVDTNKMTINFANAGHDPLIIASENKQEMSVYEALDSTPLGIAKNVGFLDQEVPINKGDLIVGFTAGVVEAKNREGKEFGLDNLKEVINQYRTWNLTKLGNKIFEKIYRFSQGQKNHQECSVLLIKVKEELVKDKETVYERRKISAQQMVK